MNGETIRMETVYENKENNYCVKIINYRSSNIPHIELPIDDNKIYKDYQTILAEDFYSESNNYSGLRFDDIPNGTLVYLNNHELVGHVSDKIVHKHEPKHTIEIEISNDGLPFYSHFIDDMENGRILYKVSVNMYGSSEKNDPIYIINIEPTKVNVFHKYNYAIIPIDYDYMFINGENMEINTESIEYLRGVKEIIANYFSMGTDITVYRDNKIFNEDSYIGVIGKAVIIEIDEDNKMLLMHIDLNHDNSNSPKEIKEITQSIYNNNLNKFKVGINLYCAVAPDINAIGNDITKKPNIFLLYDE